MNSMTVLDDVSGIRLRGVFIFTAPASAEFRVPGLPGSFTAPVHHSWPRSLRVCRDRWPSPPSTHVSFLRYRHTQRNRLKVEGGWFPKDLWLEFGGGAGEASLSSVVAQCKNVSLEMRGSFTGRSSEDESRTHGVILVALFSTWIPLYLKQVKPGLLHCRRH